MSKEEEVDVELPETPPIQMIHETFSEIITKPENPKNNTDKDKE